MVSGVLWLIMPHTITILPQYTQDTQNSNYAIDSKLLHQWLATKDIWECCAYVSCIKPCMEKTILTGIEAGTLLGPWLLEKCLKLVCRGKTGAGDGPL